jgi:hypothetical protein
MTVQGQVVTPDTARTLAAPGTVTESFGALERRANSETAAEVLAAQAKATIQARYIVAERRPRDGDAVRQKMMRECERTSFAESALYKKPVGGKTISGLSVRYAEAVARVYGNLLIDPAIIYDDATKRIVRVTATDLETNTTYSKDLLIEKTVERKQLKQGQQALSSRLNSYGDRVFLVEATEDDTLTKEAALMAKARRQLILMLVPGDLQDECSDAINSTIAKKVASDPDAEKKKLIDAFDDLGIRVEQLKMFLGVDDLSALTPKDLITLRGVYTAIRDGETNWRELMEQREAARGGKDGQQGPTSRTAEILDKLNNKQPPQSAPAPTPEANPSPAQQTPAQDASAPQQNAPAQPSGADLFGQDQPQPKTKPAENAAAKPQGGKK